MRTRNALTVVALMSVCLPAAAQPPGTPPQGEAATLYTLGQLISRTLESFALTAEELVAVQQGLEDGVLGRPPQVDLAAEAPKLHTMQAERRAALADRERRPDSDFIAAAAAEPGTVRLPAGALLRPLRPGDGPMPTPADHVRVHYEGTLPDGTVFDSSRERGRPATFPVRGVIPCWTEALQAMRVGSRSRVVCPPELAYGERGVPPAIKPNATLVFDIELLAIVP